MAVLYNASPIPSITSGLQLWLDAGDPRTMFDDTTGGDLVEPDGSIARWEDKSGLGNHAIEATLSQRPVRKVNQQNRRNTIFFDGGDELLTPIINFGDVFCVFKRQNQNQTVFRRVSSAGLRGFLGDVYPSYNTHNQYQINNNSLLSSPPNSAVGSDYYIVYATGARFNSDSFRIGFDTPAYESLIGNVAEILIFERTLDSNEVTNIRNYLNAKWGIF